MKKLLKFMTIILLFNTILFADESIRTFKGHNRSIYSMAITPDSKYIILGMDKMIKLWDIKHWKCIKTFNLYNTPAPIVVTPDNKYIILGMDKTIKLWDMKKEKIVKTFYEDTWGNFIAMTPNGKHIVSAHWNVKLWDIKSGKYFKVNNHESWIEAVAVTPDGKYIVFANRDKKLKIWDMKKEKIVKTFNLYNTPNSIAVTPDSKYVIVGSDNKTIDLYDIKNMKYSASLYGHDDWVDSVVVTSNGKYIVSSSEDRTIKLWDIKSRKCIKTFYQPLSNAFYPITVTPDGKYIVSVINEGEIKLWDIHKYEPEYINNLYNKARQKNTINAYTDFIKQVNHIAAVTQIKKAMQNIYKLAFNKAKEKNTISSYMNFIKQYPEASQYNEALSKIYGFIKNKNNIAGYEWFIKKYPNAPQVKKAMQNIYKLAFNEAKRINTISSYNTFVYAYPYAPQVKEANKRTYQMEVKKYTDLGTFGFFNKDAKMEKQARKLLIKAKQINRMAQNYQGDAKVGYIIVANRMYQLLQDKFDDSEATLNYLDSLEFRDFTDSFRKAMKDIKQILNQINDNTYNISRYAKESVNISKQAFEETKADRKMRNYIDRQHREWEKQMHLKDKGYN